ncbi:hypothetical protein AC249_AIPGENE27566 [Exaiptasia diaphana]|nr:hypothetical protein AC249_AIPGENE27566 [Exaiptasia diaphana]
MSTNNPSIGNTSLPTSTESVVYPTPTQSSCDAIRQATLNANGQRTIPYEIPIEWLDHARKCDSSTLLGIKEGGWPLVFQPDYSICSQCNNVLGDPKRHPGSKGDSVMMTNGETLFESAPLK